MIQYRLMGYCDISGNKLPCEMCSELEYIEDIQIFSSPEPKAHR